MDRRGRRGTRGHGRARGVDAEDVIVEPAIVARAGRGRGRQQGDGVEDRIMGAITQGFQALGRGRGGRAAFLTVEEERFLFFYDLFRKTSPPSFHGDNLAVAEEWLDSIKSKFRVSRAPLELRAELATHYLEDAARYWWEIKKLEFDGDQERVPREWFEKSFSDRYVSDVRKEVLRQKFVDLKQGNQSVEEYNIEFTNLSRYAEDIRADPKCYQRHYISELRARLAGEIDDPAVTDLKRLMDHAEQCEVHHKRERVEEDQARNIRPRGGQVPYQGK